MKAAAGALAGMLLGQAPALAQASPPPLSPIAKRGPSEAERQKGLARFFAPRPGESVAFKADLMRNYTGKGDAMGLYGVITVTPPPKACLTIMRHRDEPDVRVCRPTVLSFSARHLADDGSVRWEVTRDQDTTPTTLAWPTPHRLAQFVLAGADSLADMQEAPVVGCRIMKERRGRVAYVDIMGQLPLTVNLPEKDERMASEEVPNLYVTTGTPKEKPPEKEGGKEGGDEKKAEAPSGKNADHGESRTKEADEGGKSKDKAEKSPPKELWRLVPRYSFAMSADHVTANDLPHGLRGLCRYRLHGAPHDPEAGVVECHHTDHFLYLYVHLPCLHEF